MTQKGKMVHPDTRKGTVYIYKSEDGLTHFCWKDRTSGELVDDLIIFPDDADFSRVSQCTTGRVYLMKFRSSSRRFFCWMQDANDEKDKVNCKKVNELLNGPVAPAPETPVTSRTTEAKPATTTPGTTPATTSSGAAGGLSSVKLQEMLDAVSSGQGKESVTPANVITKDVVDTLLKCPDTVSKLEQHLPDQLKGNKEALRQTLNSPQFQQGLQLFSTAFKSGQLGPVMKSLGFTDSAGNAAAGGDFEAFVKAVAEATTPAAKGDVQEDMALD